MFLGTLFEGTATLTASRTFLALGSPTYPNAVTPQMKTSMARVDRL